MQQNGPISKASANRNKPDAKTAYSRTSAHSHILQNGIIGTEMKSDEWLWGVQGRRGQTVKEHRMMEAFYITILVVVI